MSKHFTVNGLRVFFWSTHTLPWSLLPAGLMCLFKAGFCSPFLNCYYKENLPWYRHLYSCSEGSEFVCLLVWFDLFSVRQSKKSNPPPHTQCRHFVKVTPCLPLGTVHVSPLLATILLLVWKHIFKAATLRRAERPTWNIYAGLLSVSIGVHYSCFEGELDPGHWHRSSFSVCKVRRACARQGLSRRHGHVSTDTEIVMEDGR